MTVRKHALKNFKRLTMPVSYKILDEENLTDSRNVFSNKGIAETRHGMHVYNTTSFNVPILSISYFKKNSEVRYKIVKAGTVLYSAAASGAHTVLKTGLNPTIKHRAETLNDRHIITLGSDGLFSFDGTTFTQLGQLAPTLGTATIASGGSLTDANNFKVGLTFYSTSTGFETNVYESAQVTTASPNKQINITAIPGFADNLTIDKVRIYLKNVTSNTSYLFVAEISLGTTSYSISSTPTSTQIPPTTHGAPISGGGEYGTLFGKKFAYAGNSSYKSEVFISEEYLPDAFNGTTSQVVLQIPGQGPITGIATGLFSDTFLTPFMVVFKKNAISVYSELNNIPNLVSLDSHVGCISQDTVRIRNGGVYFMGNGWHGIVNGILLKSNSGEAATLGNGNIDDIFSRTGWTNELNIPQAKNFFSAYYPTDFQYLTFVSEGASSAIKKAYVFEEQSSGFKVFDFKSSLTCASEGEDDLGYQTVFIGDNTGTIFTYSARNAKHDMNEAGASVTIPAYLILPVIKPGEDSNSYNFRTLTVRALGSPNNVTVKAHPVFGSAGENIFNYDFTSDSTGFILDSSLLDVGIFGDEKTPVTYMLDLNLTGETIYIGFYQDILDANIGLISAQLSVNKNGNRNR